MTRRADTDDWDAVAVQVDRLPDAWRRHARHQHVALVERWCAPLEGRWLKTDLYEERSESRSLVPDLPGPRWVGMDVSAEVAHRARGQVPLAVVTDVRAAGLATGSFDGVLSTSTLDHFEAVTDIAASLAELRRLLRPGGQLVLTLDNPTNPLVRLRNSLPRGVARRSGLVPFAVGATVGGRDGRRLLESQGFEVLAVEHLLHVPHVVGTRLARFDWYARRVMPGFERLGATALASLTGHFVAFRARAR